MIDWRTRLNWSFLLYSVLAGCMRTGLVVLIDPIKLIFGNEKTLSCDNDVFISFCLAISSMIWRSRGVLPRGL